MYGKSDYNFYPYRHPFATLHEVVHEGDTARLAEGQLVTAQMLSQVMAGLGRSIPLEILPEHVLVRTEDVVMWWTPAAERRMFFNNHSGDADLDKLNGKLYPHPPLLFKAEQNHLWVRALPKNERPGPQTRVCIAPYWNCYDNGVVCTGTMKIPREKSVAAIDVWEESFFRSEFTHAAGVRRHTRHPGGFLAMWQSLQGKKRFPARYLVDTNQTVLEFGSDHDHSYRNAAGQD